MKLGQSTHTYLYTRFPISMEHKTLKGKRDECELIR